jgi:Protein of unknown function (DUF2846)
MKKTIKCFLAICALVLISSCASIKATLEQDQKAKQLKPDDNNALVYFINKSFTGAANYFYIQEKEKDIGTLKSKTYVFAYVAPGKHLFLCKMENEGEIIIDAKPGKTYYVELIPKMGWLMARVGLELIHPSQALEYLDKCTLSKECAAIKSL